MQNLKPLNRACLPKEGRMLKSETAACHCPPQAMCPVTMEDWEGGKSLPPNIANICCSPPKECAFDKTVVTTCGRANTLVTKFEEYCYKYEVTKLNDWGGFEKLKTDVAVISARIEALRSDLQRASNSTDTTGAVFNEGMALIADIRNENAKLLKLNSDNVGKATIVCSTKASPKFCTKIISDGCPNPPPEPSCVGADCHGGPPPPPDPCTGNNCPPPPPPPPPGGCLGAGAVLVQFEGYQRCIGPSGCCVLSDSKITMGDGTLKAIKDIKVGEFVQGYASVNKVLAVNLNETSESMVSLNDMQLVMTSGHPILTRKGWKALDPKRVYGEVRFTKDITELVVGDEILMEDGKVIVLKTIDILPLTNPQKINLSVGGDFTFIANGMVLRAFKANTLY